MINQVEMLDYVWESSKNQISSYLLIEQRTGRPHDSLFKSNFFDMQYLDRELINFSHASIC
jgi:hypothetical protein